MVTWRERLRRVDIRVNNRICEFILAPFFMMLVGFLLLIFLGFDLNEEDSE